MVPGTGTGTGAGTGTGTGCLFTIGGSATVLSAGIPLGVIGFEDVLGVVNFGGAPRGVVVFVPLGVPALDRGVATLGGASAGFLNSIGGIIGFCMSDAVGSGPDVTTFVDCE